MAVAGGGGGVGRCRGGMVLYYKTPWCFNSKFLMLEDIAKPNFSDVIQPYLNVRNIIVLLNTCLQLTFKTGDCAQHEYLWSVAQLSELKK